MPVPNFPDKYDKPSLLTAVQLKRHRQKRGHYPKIDPPELVVFCYQPALLKYAVKQRRGKRVDGFLGELYLLRRLKGKVGMIGDFGVGAPVTAVLLEDLAAWGVSRFVIVGMAGGIQADLQAGDLVIVDRAIRDEGTSYHYLAAQKYVTPSGELTQRLVATCEQTAVSVKVGCTWTTDAPYRETEAEVKQYQAEGVLTVEMEAAAFLAVGEYLGVETAVALSVGDRVSENGWQLDFDGKATQQGLEQLLEIVLGMVA